MDVKFEIRFWAPGNTWEHLGTPGNTSGNTSGTQIDDVGELEWPNRAETIATCSTRGISILATFGRGPVSESDPTVFFSAISTILIVLREL